MNAPRASHLVRSAPAALSTTLPIFPSFSVRDQTQRRPRHSLPTASSSTSSRAHTIPRPAFLPLAPTRLPFNNSASCMVCHTSASASASASATASAASSPSSSSPSPSSSLPSSSPAPTPSASAPAVVASASTALPEWNNPLSGTSRSGPHASITSIVGAVSTAVVVSVAESSTATETVFMDVDTPAPTIPAPTEDQLQHSHDPQPPADAQQSQPHQQQNLDSTAFSTSTVTTADSDLPDAEKEQSGPASAPSLSFRSGIVSIPHPEKAEKGGEDAFFVQKNALGVFDGVGGWASIGVDAGLYSKELARLTASFVDREGPNAVVEALKSAHDNNLAVGSSTACVVGLNGDKLVGVNLGDSGLIVVRDGIIVYRTNEQQHYFNCPYQIGTDSMDTVEVGGPIDFTLQHGDWLVLGTDGLWDNVFPAKIVEIVLDCHELAKQKDDNSNKPSTNDAASDGGSVVSDCSATDTGAENSQNIAQQLADAAVTAANDERSSSPFAVNAQSAGHLFLGGKVDDITIIAALVLDLNQEGTSTKPSTEEVSRTADAQPSTN